MKSTLLAIALLATSSFAATPAETAIRQAKQSIQKEPAHFPYYNSLASAYARRARETADPKFYAQADDALQKSFALSPDNFDGQKVEASLLLGRHQFRAALELATKLNKIAPDDLAVYGYLVDANVELGNYADAIVAAQWMLDLRPGNVPAMARAAYLRELHGNLSGALDLLQTAYESLPQQETEDRAWLLTQTSHVQLLSGDLPQAEASAKQALTVFPAYPDALSALAEVRIAQEHYSEAVVLLQQRQSAAPCTSVLYLLAEAQERAGLHEDSAATFRQFEDEARQQATQPDNANRQLIAYYIDHGRPTQALDLARREAALRHDVFTLDSLACALAANGDTTGGSREMQKALALGTKDPRLLSHDAAIAAELKNTQR